MPDSGDDLRAKASALYRLARQTRETSEGLVHLLRATEIEQQAEELDRGDMPAARVLDGTRPRTDRDNI